MTDATLLRVDSDALRAFVSEVYRSAGASPEDAHVAADAIGQADLWGHQPHGVPRLGWYYAGRCSGAMKAAAHASFPVIGREGARHRRGVGAQLEPLRHETQLKDGLYLPVDTLAGLDDIAARAGVEAIARG